MDMSTVLLELSELVVVVEDFVLAAEHKMTL